MTIHSDDAFAPVGYLKLVQLSFSDKANVSEFSFIGLNFLIIVEEI